MRVSWKESVGLRSGCFAEKLSINDSGAPDSDKNPKLKGKTKKKLRNRLSTKEGRIRMMMTD